MNARNILAAAAAIATLAAPIAAQAAEPAPLPSKLYLVDVDTRECFEATGVSRNDIVTAFDSVCRDVMQIMPTQRRIKHIRLRVDRALCPRVEITDAATGKVSKERQCRTSINPRKLNDYQVVFLAHQLRIPM